MESENFFHSPTVCLPSSRWKQLQKTTHTIQNAPVFVELKVTQMVVEQMGLRQLVYFWFQTKDRTTHDKNINRFHLTL
ncbi:exosortase-associated EpsI family protein [Desulfosarcina ovata]|uniref:exosortase-associated EpsI family protein n=1 Tax=Desulfosarcina ovata TaxID=83564 RepID=UPI0012D3610F|nr:exosortase-associated EpsI family protein [Desulfosarcina ovata]